MFDCIFLSVINMSKKKKMCIPKSRMKSYDLGYRDLHLYKNLLVWFVSCVCCAQPKRFIPRSSQAQYKINVNDRMNKWNQIVSETITHNTAAIINVKTLDVVRNHFCCHKTKSKSDLIIDIIILTSYKISCWLGILYFCKRNDNLKLQSNFFILL